MFLEKFIDSFLLSSISLFYSLPSRLQKLPVDATKRGEVRRRRSSSILGLFGKKEKLTHETSPAHQFETRLQKQLGISPRMLRPEEDGDGGNPHGLTTGGVDLEETAEEGKARVEENHKRFFNHEIWVCISFLVFFSPFRTALMSEPPISLLPQLANCRNESKSNFLMPD